LEGGIINYAKQIKEENLEILSKGTRDNTDLNVWIDKKTKVIFIDDYYVGEDEYSGGLYSDNSTNKSNLFAGRADEFIGIYRHHEDELDTERRYNRYRQFIGGKDICDFGCEAGSFLKFVMRSAKNITGIELQESYVKNLNAIGIDCFKTLYDCNKKFDLITMFHCLEHLPDPLKTLSEIRGHLRENGIGKVVIEVPHARDFLIDHLSLDGFIKFTLWSQHLVLHTRESLGLMLGEAGFKNIVIEGAQRYSLSNHIYWMTNNLPGGHQAPLSILDSPDLRSSYASALSRIDSNDTLIAVATT
jgi:SAM-dependent methyltransferase